MAAESNLETTRSITKRLQRMLAGIERARRQPNRREAYYICLAMEHLSGNRIAESEEALRKAERIDPVPPEVAAQPALNETPTVEQLRMALDRLTQSQRI